LPEGAAGLVEVLPLIDRRGTTLPGA